jgi:hypothetical protein
MRRGERLQRSIIHKEFLRCVEANNLVEEIASATNNSTSNLAPSKGSTKHPT